MSVERKMLQKVEFTAIMYCIAITIHYSCNIKIEKEGRIKECLILEVM